MTKKAQFHLLVKDKLQNGMSQCEAFNFARVQMVTSLGNMLIT